MCQTPGHTLENKQIKWKKLKTKTKNKSFLTLTAKIKQ